LGLAEKGQLLHDASNQLFVRFEKERLAFEEEFERTSSFDLTVIAELSSH
jgi:hypothetical protein